MGNDLLERRARLLGPNVPIFYDRPVEIVRGQGAYLFDARGQRYLDAYNNVAHCGHSHPRIVKAICEQAGVLNTHTRYLHEGILDYAETLLGKVSFPGQLLMTCTGSEANDVALRMAQAVTGKRGFIATDNTYHGNTTAVAHLSTRRPPIGGWPDHIRRVPAPDSLAPLGGSLDAQPEAFAANVARAIDELEASGHGFAGFMLCPIFANEGMPGVAPGFLDPTVEVIRRAGGLILCDEVQPGFGRIGSNFWGHEWLGFTPDVVTMGKPMGNGHPVAGLVAAPQVMAAFREAFGYFNTFGGNPVSVAAAMEVLRVIEEEGLQENAAEVGAYLLDGLRELSHPLIADTRGLGLFLGIELARDGEPASAEAGRIVEAMRDRHVLMGRVGRAQHILKIRPPMVFSRADADELIGKLSDCFEELPA
ncbi:aspartate aminotransferase family protein [Thioclava marina]|uniref:Aspartate aminotransferase family protein n=1 Tax=Thioclava marina TaxID=1915077 RepID=A0ABX3MRD5_9RHOB|nr:MULTISPECIES: aminotransferase class III-fold pyridoxal phosphate-dependent enzyme [Thioclava]OOY13952.1 aspartate aminotransferase family protein [Thioclava marina]OOY29658.1 aspartate aminotransferase family protein [Thioclava sp. L04-15]TNE94130.1 MAG: aminotransferase class III-fold pyridoxal phosphate-dependent enzyme [Paracoccaceae bacterium]